MTVKRGRDVARPPQKQWCLEAENIWAVRDPAAGLPGEQDRDGPAVEMPCWGVLLCQDTQQPVPYPSPL
ncbi:unnamed protein product [Rangifer tarandus platyrhynchus]|uniref:Uncharacterized protein n=1 Tax=Rangifer tarandus platyrhynchus TaxID=3082113 RepID=A0AC59Z700_RANTA